MIEVASVRHSLWVQNQDTLAGACFSTAHLLDSINWQKPLNLLDEWTVLDWPVWSTCRRSHGMHSAYVKDVFFQVSLARWKPQLAKHVMPLKYLSVAQEPPARTCCSCVADARTPRFQAIPSFRSLLHLLQQEVRQHLFTCDWQM